MSHYHFHTERTVQVDGKDKLITHNYVVAKDFAAQEQQVAVESGYSVKWHECAERLCFDESRANLR